MTLTNFAAPNAANKSGAADRIVGAARAATHLAHQARWFTCVGGDAIEDGVHVAKRTVKAVERRVEALVDLRDEAVHGVKRQPLIALGAAFAVGVIVGVAAGWMGSCDRRVTAAAI